MDNVQGVRLEEREGVRLAIEGCGHGTFHAIYASIAKACEIKGWPDIDLLIIGGDFQAVRNAYDLNCVSMPVKYREMCDFHEYYSSQRTAPYLTIFVGGNHEASNYLFELYYGGWVAPNIYYMGAANVLRLGPLRIAGLSGIWKGYSYKKPHTERLPYNESDIKSIYHVRELDTRKLLQLRTQVDIGVSHDWPRGVEYKGNHKQLFREPKEHLKEDAENGQLGSVAAKQVMDRLRPRWWFSAHLHCKYAAVVRHDDGAASSQPVNGTAASREDGSHAAQLHGAADPPNEQPAAKNEDEIDLDLDDEPVTEGVSVPIPTESNGKTTAPNADEIDLELEDDANGIAPVAPGQCLDGVQVAVSASTQHTADHTQASNKHLKATNGPAKPVLLRRDGDSDEQPPEIKNLTTHFLALDKCLPGRDFLQLMNIPTATESELHRPLKLEYDREWLSVTRAFALSEPIILGDSKFNAPRAQSSEEYAKLIDEAGQWIENNLCDSQLTILENFTVTAPIYDGGDFRSPEYSQASGGLREYTNPQTSSFCEMLQIPNPFVISEEERDARMAAGPKPDPDAHRFGGGRGRGRGRGGGFGRGGGNRGGRGDRGRGRGGRRGR